MDYRSRILGVGALVAAAVLFPMVPAPARAASDCEGTVSAELTHKEVEEDLTHLQFSVDVSSTERCARIEYDLVIEELLPNGQANRVRKTRFVNLDDGSLTEIVEHRMPSGHRMLSFEAKLFECRRCVLEP